MATMMSEDEILKELARCGAVQEGHFRLTSGLHSKGYVQCALALQHPELARRLCEQLAEPWRSEAVSAVIGPALGGVVLAYELARALGVRGLFMEREDGAMVLRRSFSVAPGERVLLAEDVMTTGGSVAEMVEALEAQSVRIAGVACLVDRGGAARFADRRVRALLRLDIETFKPEDCPLCRDGVPVAKPGSRKHIDGDS